LIGLSELVQAEYICVTNMPQLCVAAYGCLEGMWLPTSGHYCLNSITYIGDNHYLDIDSINAVIINAHLCSHSEQYDSTREAG
jgi:hypothetical protein